MLLDWLLQCPIRFEIIVFPFSLVSWYFKIYFFGCLVACCLASMYLWFLQFFLVLDFYLYIVVVRKDVRYVFNLFQFIDLFFGLACDLSWRMFHVHLKRMCISLLLDGMLYIYPSNSHGLMWHLRTVFPYRFSVWMICPLMKVRY